MCWMFECGWHCCLYFQCKIVPPECKCYNPKGVQCGEQGCTKRSGFHWIIRDCRWPRLADGENAGHGTVHYCSCTADQRKPGN
uniref:PtrLHT4 n=1 Tax=Arundo donax TaxID=35708 RepID=A0A0A9HLY0_ARUDO